MESLWTWVDSTFGNPCGRIIFSLSNNRYEFQNASQVIAPTILAKWLVIKSPFSGDTSVTSLCSCPNLSCSELQIGLHIWGPTVHPSQSEKTWLDTDPGIPGALTRWWFQTFLEFSPFSGKIPIFNSIFQRGWFNHQPVKMRCRHPSGECY